ncbi:hypothetical protein [Sphingomonas sp.]|jgi:hypothetical protein|uniref:hypothetical protein n=1 Tax=Sphingomonas sp. TaxID=28214 RepID=UPI002D7E1B93|nr:hypothetical protein [Sphingomonas sp.]HEU0045235.1 hypothetical protein [Sphingomonas sp.]
MPFLTHRDFEDLPDNDEEAFSYLVSKIDERVSNAETDSHGNLTYMTIGDYMNEVGALAQQFSIPGISFTPPNDDYFDQYNKFQWSVQASLTRIRVTKARRDTHLSVDIAAPVRRKIHHYLEQLKTEIVNANLDAKRSRALLDRIKELEVELAGGKRVNLAVVMAVVALTLQATTDAGEMLLNARKYAGAISQLIGSEKVKEPQVTRPPPQQRIEDKRPALKHTQGSPVRPNITDDDDVPF